MIDGFEVTVESEVEVTDIVDIVVVGEIDVTIDVVVIVVSGTFVFDIIIFLLL